MGRLKHKRGVKSRASRNSKSKSGATPNRKLTRHLKMGNPKDCSTGLIREAFDFPAVGQHDLLHDGQPQAGPFFGAS